MQIHLKETSVILDQGNYLTNWILFLVISNTRC